MDQKALYKCCENDLVLVIKWSAYSVHFGSVMQSPLILESPNNSHTTALNSKQQTFLNQHKSQEHNLSHLHSHIQYMFGG